RERRNQSQHFIEQDKTEWSSDRRQVISPYARDDKWRMGEPLRKKHQYQMNRETGNAQSDGQPFEQGLVGLRKDLIVSSNQLLPESGHLQRMTMVTSVPGSHGCSDSPGLCPHSTNAQVARSAAAHISWHIYAWRANMDQ